MMGGQKHTPNSSFKMGAMAALLLILPVLFILLLPSLVFGGLTGGFSSNDPAAPLLNSEAALIENANEISFAINRILGEGLEDVTARIEADFAVSGGDRFEIINPYESSPVYNANLFISQYCASRDTDFAAISLSDLEDVLRQGKSSLYSYTRTEEIREKPVTDSETGDGMMEPTEADSEIEQVSESAREETETEETTETEKWMIYTVSYNGESYFADEIFALTDAQKALAADYVQNLSLFLGDGLLQDLSGWSGGSITSLGNVRLSDGSTEVVYFSQLDERYTNEPYGTDPIGTHGCGPTSMAIVVSSLTDEIIDPAGMARWAYENGYWCKNSGSYHSLIPGAAQHWGLAVSGCSVSEPQRILDALAEGKLVVALMTKGHFANCGHFIVLRGVKDGQILVADPASYERSSQLWDFSIILDEASRRAGAGGPFWIIG